MYLNVLDILKTRYKNEPHFNLVNIQGFSSPGDTATKVALKYFDLG
jgi:hypothetical protein